MAVYFVDPYKKYYEELKNATALSSKKTDMINNSEMVSKTISRLQSQLNGALWSELGYKELVTNAIPALHKSSEILKSNISSCLAVAVDTALNSLLPVVSELKIKDEELEKKIEELNNLKEPLPATEAVYDSITGKKIGEEETSSHKAYRDKKASLEKEIATLKESCEKLVNEANTYKEKINGLSGGAQTVTAVSIPTASSTTSVANYPGIKEYTLDSSMIVGQTDALINYGEYYVVNTAYSVEDYQKHILDRRIYQSGSNGFENSCSTIAHVYAKNLTMGYAYDNIKAAVKDGGSSPDGYYNNNLYISDNKQDVLAEVYSELSQGRPVTLNCANSNGGRHWITIVGFKTSVSSGQALKAEDLLILDPWDGQVERMDCSDSRIMATGSETGQTENYTGYRIDRLNNAAIAQIPSKDDSFYA